MHKQKTKGTFLLAAILVALVASVVSAGDDPNFPRPGWDYSTDENGVGTGIWSVEVDSRLIPGLENDPCALITFTAPMAEPAFTQVDTLNVGDVDPGGASVGWVNDDADDGDGFDGGEGKGMSWKFYQSTDTVTLTTTTPGYETYIWVCTTKMSSTGSNAGDSHYDWNADIFDVPENADVVGNRRLASFWGDVDNPGPDGGHRHSGDTETYIAGQDEFTDEEGGHVDSNADGDGIGFSLALRSNGAGDTLFIKNIHFWGDVLADTADIAACQGLIGDLTGDCKVTIADLAIVAQNWLECNLVPQSACP